MLAVTSTETAVDDDLEMFLMLRMIRLSWDELVANLSDWPSPIADSKYVELHRRQL
jgi:hypothetical protein